MLFGDVNYRIKFKIGRKKWSGGGNYKGKWKWVRRRGLLNDALGERVDGEMKIGGVQ